ncbi:MAG: hypothetical protein HC916_20110 [Coleofasciculaceae cyanobacterium SM2_1_6]|nr:hypothetical protein [Coleofasciculaceae cyanobacterium SM2_1_6]
MAQKINKIDFLDVDNRLKKEGLSNILLAADCFIEVEKPKVTVNTLIILLKRLQEEVEQEKVKKNLGVNLHLKRQF